MKLHNSHSVRHRKEPTCVPAATLEVSQRAVRPRKALVCLAILLCPGAELAALAQGAGSWVKQAGGAEGRSVAALPDGGLLVTGVFLGKTAFGVGEPKPVTFVSAGIGDMFLARYRADGALVWAKRAGGKGDDMGNYVAAMPDGGAAVTGKFWGAVTFGDGEPGATTLRATGRYDIFLSRYRDDGTLVWATSAGARLWNQGLGVAALPDGGVLMAGYFEERATFGRGTPQETHLKWPAGEGKSYFVARYSPEGALMWARQIGTRNFGPLIRIRALPDGGALVAGWLEGEAIFGKGEPGETKLAAGGAWAYFLARYRPDGMLVWAKGAGGPVWSGATGGGFGLLPDGSALATGKFGEQATFGAGEPGATTLTAEGGITAFLARHRPDGTLQWVKRIATPSGWAECRPIAVAALPDGGVVVAGKLMGEAVFGPGEPHQTTLKSAGLNDVFAMKYGSDGRLTWARRFGGPGQDGATSVAVLADGRVAVTGSFEGTVGVLTGQPALTAASALGDLSVACFRVD